MNHANPLPVAVIGAGPVGLAAAAHLLERGLQPLVFEAGAAVGASISEWGHVRVFSPWEFDVDPVAVALLERHGWTAPDPAGYPTGDEIVTRYLEPLAATPEVAPSLRLNAKVLGVARAGIDKLKDAGRDEAPFELLVDEGGVERRYLASAVIDASGTWTRPNPLGAGLPASGEAALRERVAYGIPDVLGDARARFAGKRVVVVGSGHSAFNAILDLVALRESEPATQIVWADPRRRSGPQVRWRRSRPAARARRARRGGASAGRGWVRRARGRLPDALGRQRGGSLVLADGEREIVADEVIAATGFRPGPRAAARAAARS